MIKRITKNGKETLNKSSRLLQRFPDSADTTALLGALCFFFSTVEYMIPKPLPFLRLGLANMPIMLGMELLSLPQLLLVVLIKIIGQGLIGGTLFSYIFLFSAAGTLASSAVMIGLKRLAGKRLSYTGISVAGALGSNGVQLLLARYLIFGSSAWLIAPPFIVLGTITSLLLGMFTNWFVMNSRWFGEKKRQPSGDPVSCNTPVEKGKESSAAPLFRFLSGLGILAALFFAPGIMVTAVCFAAAAVLALASGGKLHPIPIVFMCAGIVFFNLLAPAGRVLFSVARFPVTAGALLMGIKKALTIEGMIFLSRWMIAPGFSLPGYIGRLVSRSFEILALLFERKERFDPKHVIASIDSILMSLHG
ncbi:MAG: Gx transporter family protein [Spirochaetaceae bacterium]|jgi:uncharacterized membrane protein|nr:Gx transporter family protein [Spirochaetaceae bacterium]